jgi:oligopeptide transport system substrate-binding protein
LKRCKKVVALVATVGLAGVMLAGCGNGNSTTTTTTTNSGPVEGGAINLDTNAVFKDLDPAKAYDTQSWELVTEIYNRLLTYKGATNQLTPQLAESYTVSSDGKTYTFKIRKGVKFTNGDPVTAQSFVDEFERVLSPSVHSPGEGFLDPIVVGSTAFNKGRTKTISGVTTPDPYTLVIKLTQPEPFFPMVLAMPFFSAVDKKYIDQVGDKAFDTQVAMGCGPFKLASYTTNQVVLEKNKDYFLNDDKGNRLPYLDKITIRINKDDQTDGLNFQKGDTAFIGNLMNGIPSSIYPTFMSDPNLSKTVIHAPQNSVYYIGLNNKIKPFNNLKVRQAMEYAINKEKIVRLLNNRVIPADQPLPPGIDGYVKDLPADAKYSFNPAKAKQLLKEAGYPNGFTTTLYSNNTNDDRKIDQSIQADLAAVGVTVNIHEMDWNAFLDLNEQGKTDMFSLAWIQDFPDASDFLNTLFNTNQQPQNNSTLYSNPKVDALLNKAQTDTNLSERNALYKQATELIMKDAPWVPLYYKRYDYAVQPWVHNFYINPTLPDPLEFIWIDQNHSAK